MGSTGAIGPLLGAGLLATVVALVPPACGQDPIAPVNILLITADDLGRSSVGVYGCGIPEITPNIDRLAAEGMRFDRAHVTVSVCQPSRSVWMTGRYPHRNGAEGFEPVAEGVPILTAQLKRAGYFNGILGKVTHLGPRPTFEWDYVVEAVELDDGRSPAKYGDAVRAFVRRAAAEEAPFFLMANTHDPHRPFLGVEPPRTFAPEEIEVPPFLPDIPGVRAELAEYFAAVHRMDRTVGAILEVLDEEGVAGETLVVFTSDHGMPFPFAKANCYPQSTSVPLLVRWPGTVNAGGVDRDHYVSGIDLMPTLLELARAADPGGMDGASFAPLLRGEAQEGRDTLVTVFHRRRKSEVDFPMRAVHDGRYCYIFNAWSDGRRRFPDNQKSGASSAMSAAARRDPALAARLRLLRLRVPEELFDLESDPYALHDLAGDPEHAAPLRALRQQLLEFMESKADPLLQQFRRHLGSNGR